MAAPTPLQRVLVDHGFTSDEVKAVCCKGMDQADTIKELWAFWFACHCKSDQEFLDERSVLRGVPLILTKDKQAILLGLVHGEQAQP
jgi:hypothetical protein